MWKEVVDYQWKYVALSWNITKLEYQLLKSTRYFEESMISQPRGRVLDDF